MTKVMETYICAIKIKIEKVKFMYPGKVITQSRKRTRGVVYVTFFKELT